MTHVDEAEPLIVDFESFVGGHGTRDKGDIVALAAAIQKIDTMPLDCFGGSSQYDRSSKRDDAKRRCLNGYMAQQLSGTFPVLDEALFARKRYIGVRFPTAGRREAEPFATRLTPFEGKRVDGDVPERWVECPLLVQYGTSGRSRSNEAVRLGGVKWPNERGNDQCVLYARFPSSIGPAQLQYADKALALFYRLRADLLERRDTAPLARWNLSEPSVSAYWIPSLASIYAKREAPPDRRDPALVIEAVGHKFLCCMWVCDGEEPIDALFREFGVGGKVNVADD